ncbi:MAG: membrane protease subunit HflK [Rhodobacteraceae bacterium HLUCCA08]|nr:MAG: membrane protease subunit HflK [Rhodobacteraceae bacterium HLUCCA08]
MAGNNGGPWGGGGRGGGDDDDRDRDRPDGRRPENGPQIPEFEEFVTKTRDQLRVLMGGGGRGGNGGGQGPGAGGPQVTRGMVGLGLVVAVGAWLAASFYTVRPEQRSVELLFGAFHQVGNPGLNFAPWPVVTRVVLNVTEEQVVEIGGPRASDDESLMLTGDENIVDVQFNFVWNIDPTRPEQYLFNLAEPEQTVAIVAESVMRELVAQSEFSPLLNRDRQTISDQLALQVQQTLDSYDSGVNVVRVNLLPLRAPDVVVDYEEFDESGNAVTVQTSPQDAYLDVQSASAEQNRVRNQANVYANQALAGARGRAAAVLEGAIGYEAETVNAAEGSASRFLSVLAEYSRAPEVTRERLFLEAMGEVYGDMDVILMESDQAGADVVPYLTLDRLRNPTSGGNN